MIVHDLKMELISTKIKFFRNSLKELDKKLDECDNEMNEMVEGVSPLAPDKLNIISIKMSAIYHEIAFFRYELKYHLKIIAN